MPRQKTGSIFTRKDRPGLWVKVPYRDESGRTRYLQRRVESPVKGRPANKTDARNLIKQLTGEIERQGVRAIDGDRLTFAELAKIYEDRKIVPPVGFAQSEPKIAGGLCNLDFCTSRPACLYTISISPQNSGTIPSSNID